MALDQSAAAVGLGQLQSLPFKNIIGGPLTAAIDAQALAAETTVRFIERIGFDIVNGQHHAVNLESPMRTRPDIFAGLPFRFSRSFRSLSL